MALAHGPITAERTSSLPGKIGSALAVLVALALIVAAMFLPVVQSSDATTTGYTIRHNQQQLEDLQAQIHSSEAAIAQLGSMSRIQSEAARLGMVPAKGAGAAVTINTPADDAILIPRRYLPAPTPQATPAGHRSLISSLLKELSLQ